MATTFVVSLANGLKTADGKVFRGTVKESFSTPGFRVKGVNMMDYFDAADASAQPRLMLLFSADVDPAALAAQVKFVDAEKHSVDAIVRRPGKDDGYFPPYQSDDRSVLTWEAQVREHLAGGPVKPNAPKDGDDEEEQPAPKAVPVLKNAIL